MISYSFSSEIKPRLATDLLVDLPEVVLVNKFSEEAVDKFRTSFNKASNSKQPAIPIVIDSYGGEVYSLLAMVDLIKNANKPVATIVQGKAMSCGAILFSMGKEGQRYISPTATVMIHDVSNFSFGKVEEIKSDAAETERLNKIIYKLMANNVGKPDHYFLDIVHAKGHADWYLTAEDCKEHNLANHIRLPSLKVSVEVTTLFA